MVGWWLDSCGLRALLHLPCREEGPVRWWGIFSLVTLLRNFQLSNKVSQQIVPAQKPRSTKASKMPSKLELMMKKVSNDYDDAKLFEEIENSLKKHVTSWEVFFKTLGEQVWNVPNFVPKMNIEREWEFTDGLVKEVSRIYCLNIIGKHLQIIFLLQIMCGKGKSTCLKWSVWNLVSADSETLLLNWITHSTLKPEHDGWGVI